MTIFNYSQDLVAYFPEHLGLVALAHGFQWKMLPNFP